MLIPLKTRDPKSRLAGALSADERAELMRTLLERVRRSRAGGRRRAGDRSQRRADRRPRGLADGGLAWNDALAAATADLVHAPLVAVVSADLPFLRGEEVEELLAATPERGIAIARALDGGTNAVAMRPPGLVPTRFGEPGSAAVHAALRRARCRGRPPGPRVRRRHGRRPRQDAGRVGLKLGYKASAEQFPPRRLLDLSTEAERLGLELVGVSDHFQPFRHTTVTARRACPGSARSASAPSAHCSGRACSPRRCATTPRSSPRRSGRSPA